MGYCFMSIEKIKTKASMLMKYQHNYRTTEVLNADKSKKHFNEELVNLNGKTYVDAFDAKINLLPYYNNNKVRKNAVLALEIVTTFSREDAEYVDIKRWKGKNVEWLKETFNVNTDYGDNVVSVVYHGDENGNFHCHTCVIPVDDRGRLNSCYYIGGRDKIVHMQDTYAEKMKEFGLQRGLKGTVAKHEDIKRFYASLNQAIVKELPSVRKKGILKESAEEYRERANEVFKTSNLQQLNVIKKMERKIAEARTYNLQDMIDGKSAETKHKEEIKNLEMRLDKYEDFERKWGSIAVVETRLRAFDTLLKGALEYLNAFPKEAPAIEQMTQTIKKVLKHKKTTEKAKTSAPKKQQKIDEINGESYEEKCPINKG